MTSKPIWNIKPIPLHYSQIDRDLSVDVTIIGGGITGITTAQFLKDKGLNVAVLEGRKIGQGTTGQSTGNLYVLTEYHLTDLHSKYDIDVLQKVINARGEAINHIRQNVANYNLDCEFKSQPMYVFQTEETMDMDKELQLASDLGLGARELKDPDFLFKYQKGLMLPDQAQFNPLAYTQQLAAHIADDNCQIFENSCVVAIDEDGNLLKIKTVTHTVSSKYVVHATHTPKGLQVQYHTALGPYREYGIGVKLTDNKYPEGIFWGNFKNRKYSIRTFGAPDNPYLICVGSMHKVGQAEDNRNNIQELKEFVQQHFNVEQITHEWGGQNYKAADMLPYIGQMSSGSHEYIATGFSTDGLVYGTLAAKLISDHILNLPNPFADTFKAHRHQPFKAAKNFTKENINVVGKLVGDYFKKGASEDIDNLQPDQGKLLQLEEGKYAVYKTVKGNTVILSPICPHMGCTVHWNKAEKSWDCPCHGSRFDTYGNVIEGPAFHGLKPMV